MSNKLVSKIISGLLIASVISPFNVSFATKGKVFKIERRCLRCRKSVEKNTENEVYIDKKNLKCLKREFACESCRKEIKTFECPICSRNVNLEGGCNSHIELRKSKKHPICKDCFNKLQARGSEFLVKCPYCRRESELWTRVDNDSKRERLEKIAEDNFGHLCPKCKKRRYDMCYECYDRNGEKHKQCLTCTVNDPRTWSQYEDLFQLVFPCIHVTDHLLNKISSFFCQAHPNHHPESQKSGSYIGSYLLFLQIKTINDMCAAVAYNRTATAQEFNQLVNFLGIDGVEKDYVKNRYEVKRVKRAPNEVVRTSELELNV